MSEKPYVVENNRPRRTVTLYGRTLAPRGAGRTSLMHLSEDQLLGASCVRLFKLGRLRLAQGELPEALASTLSEEASADPTPVPPAPAPQPTPAPEPQPVPEPLLVEDPPEAPVVEEPEEESSERPITDGGLTAMDVRDLSYAEIKKLAKSLDLSGAGKKATLQERVIDALGLGD